MTFFRKTVFKKSAHKNTFFVILVMLGMVVGPEAQAAPAHTTFEASRVEKGKVFKWSNPAKEYNH